jgi:bacillithiol system protein YtxJ
VVEARPASNHVATRTGITHESPQIIFFKDGKAVFDRDNWDITGEAVAEALESHFIRV